MERDEGGEQKKYEAPTVTRVSLQRDSSRTPEAQTLCGKVQGDRTSTTFRIVLDLDGRFRKISEEFCGLAGYTREELQGKRIDKITAACTVDVPQHLGAVVHFGHFHCLWMFALRVCRTIVVRSDWSLLPDMSMEVHGELIPAQGFRSRETHDKRNLIDPVREAFYSLSHEVQDCMGFFRTS